MKKESLKIRFKRWWHRMKERIRSKRTTKPRGVDSSKVNGHSSVQSTLDKLNGK